VYRQLEDFLEKQGHSDMADRVYIAQKRRERKEVLEWYSITWWWNLFLDWFIRYGRSPDLAFLYSIVVVLFGSIVFWKKDGMQSTGGDATSKKEVPSRIHKTIPRLARVQNLSNRARPVPAIDYSPIWYSLDLFISIVDLHMAKYWEPQPGRRWARLYMRFHIIMGWILIPISLLALTGVIR
jgi:hypothetical protein